MIAQIEDAIADHDLGIAGGEGAAVREFDPEGLRRMMHQGLADLAMFLEGSEGL